MSKTNRVLCIALLVGVLLPAAQAVHVADVVRVPSSGTNRTVRVRTTSCAGGETTLGSYEAFQTSSRWRAIPTPA
jgi:hypothetical protein